MPQSPNKITQFWQELKRRNVHRSLAIYAGTAFIILEAADILFPRWGLPDWTFNLVLYLLILGAVITIIVSWIYDVTPEGIERTRPLKEIQEGEKPVVPYEWKIATYVSLAVIIGLIIFNLAGGFKQLKASPILSLLIFPIENYTGDDQLDNVLSGMHSSLIGDIGRINGLRVLSKTTSDYYRNADMTLLQIAEELGADAVMEPAVMCYGDSICIRLTMFNEDEEQIWNAEYTEAISQIFNLHNQLTRQIADEVKIELTPDKERLLAESRTVDPDALDAYLKGLSYYEQTGKENFEMAREYFEMAIEIAPDWAPPYAGLTRVWGALAFFGIIPQNIAYPEMDKYFQKALELDPNSANSHFIRAQNAAWHEWDWETAEREFLRSQELNPNDALCRMMYAHLLMCLRRTDEAVYQARLGLELDPLRPLILGLYGVVMISERDYQSAIEHCEKALSIDPDNKFAPGPLAYAHRFTGDTLKWYEMNKALFWNDENYFASLDSIFQEHGYRGVIEEIIRVNEEVYINGGQISFRDLAEGYCILGKYDKAMDYLEKAYEMNDRTMAYTSTDAIDYPELKYNPRYIALLKKMNLPLPED